LQLVKRGVRFALPHYIALAAYIGGSYFLSLLQLLVGPVDLRGVDVRTKWNAPKLKSRKNIQRHSFKAQGIFAQILFQPTMWIVPGMEYMDLNIRG
jgi:hypothetical protein